MENMDIGRSFTFMFQDKNWVVKILVGGLVVLLSILLIPIPLMLGYQLRVIRNTSQGADVPLPEWDDLGSYFSDGIQLIVGGIIYYSPVILLTCVLVGLSALADGGDRRGDGEGIVGLFLFCVNCLVTILSIVIGLIFPAAMLRFAATNRLGSMLEFGEVLNFVRRNVGNYIVAVLLGWVASLIAGVLALVTCFLGTPWASWWSTLVQGHLLGQVWRASQGPVTTPTIEPTSLGGGEVAI